MQVAGQHHVGFPVSDLDAAIGFLHHFGFVERARVRTGETTAVGNGVPGLRFEVAFLEGPGGVVELLRPLEGVAPAIPPAGLAGAAHLCLRVEDIDAVHAELSASGLAPVSAPQREPDLDARWMFVEGPEGLRVEIVQLGRAAA